MNCMTDRLRLGVVGEEDAILAFKAIGAIAMPAITSDEINKALHRLVSDKVPVIFITEQAARLVPEAIKHYDTLQEVAIIPVPGIRGTDGYGRDRVRENVIKAIGADILLQQDRNEE